MKRRRFMVAAALAAAVALSLGGCSAGASGGRQQLTMWFWGAPPADQTALNKILADGFDNSQSKYDLTITYNNSVDTNVQTALAANRGPDIVYGSGPAFVSPYAQANKLVDLDKYSKEYGWKSKTLAPIYQSGTVHGKLYALTTSISTYGIFYNKKVLQENGWPVPTTQAQLLGDMNAAQAKGMYASVTGDKGWQPTNLDYASLFLGSVAGPKVMYDALTGKTSWTNPAIEKAIDTSKQWYQKGYLGGKNYQNLNFDDAMQLLAEGKSPFFISPTLSFQFAYQYFNKASGNANDLGFVPFPNINPTLGSQVEVLSTVNSLSINANSKNQQGAAEVLNYMMNSSFRNKITAAWPGYWGLPFTAKYDTADFTGLSAAFASAVNHDLDVVAQGNFSFDASTFFPPDTEQDFVNLDSVWLNKQSTGNFLTQVNSNFQSELKKGTVPPIPVPTGVGTGN